MIREFRDATREQTLIDAIFKAARNQNSSMYWSCDDHFERIAVIREALSIFDAAQWRSMKRAPRDGTRIIVWFKDDNHPNKGYRQETHYVDGEVKGFASPLCDRDGWITTFDESRMLCWLPVPPDPVLP